MTLQSLEALTCDDVPQTNRGIFAATGEFLTIGAVRNWTYSPDMAV